VREETEKTACGILAVAAICGILFSCVLLQPWTAWSQDSREKAVSLVKESVSLSKAGNLDKAEELVREALKADPNNAEACDQLGKVLLRKGLNDQAADAFNAALKINPRLNSSKTGLGVALFRKGDLNGAETALKEALRNNPYPSQTHYALGLVYEKQDQYDKALFEFKEGIRTFKSEKK
jgi:Flp pilus assembly protein TadD